MTFSYCIFSFISTSILFLFTMASPLLGDEPIYENTTTTANFGMDVIIVSTSTKQQQKYWQQRLQSLRGRLISENAYLLVLLEEWPGGAGNGYGSLHAYQEAQKEAKKLYNLDLLEYQNQGHSIAIYHTAGQGKRLSPLTASEKNNKSAVKLPCGLSFLKDEHTIAILEAVIWQSVELAPYRKGRLSVFWGDQVFLSKKPLNTIPQHDIDIYATSKPLPNREKWSSEGLDKYGLFAADSNNTCCYLEKASYDTVEKLIKKGKIDPKKNVAISIGSFSLTTSMTKALLEEFNKELEEKTEMMNVEHSLWMPFSLDVETYCDLMIAMGWTKKLAEDTHKRITAFKNKYLKDNEKGNLIGISDIGQDGYWWDYGTIKNYYHNILKLTKHSEESDAMRAFFSLSTGKNQTENPLLDIDNNSIVLGSSIKSGRIENSILIGVQGENIDFKETISIASTFTEAIAEKSLLYNVKEINSCYFPSSSVSADILFSPENSIKITTLIERDGKVDWNSKVENNSHSYQELELLNEQHAQSFEQAL